jgi:ferredoxin
MKVWIDQDLCTGDGLCEEIAPVVFELDSDGLAYVKNIGQAALRDENNNPIHSGSTGLVKVATELEESVIEAAEECPGECIFIEKD